MIRTILVALDGSYLAEQALAPACRLAQQTEATIVLVRVAPPFTMVSENLASPGSGTVREAEVYLNAVAERVVREGLTVRVVALHGLTPQAIVTTAQGQGADLIAIGTHGRSGLRQVMLGSVAQEVLHQTTVPVLLVRAGEPPATMGAGPYRTILVPLDGTAFAEAALAYLAQAELDRAATLVLLRAVSPPTIPPTLDPILGGLPGYPPAELLDQREKDTEAGRQEAIRYLDFVGRRRLQGRTYQTLVRVDDPARAILKAAASERVELIVMATHGRSGLDRLLHGSVAGRVLHHMPAPVLFLHPMPAPVVSLRQSAAGATTIDKEQHHDNAERLGNPGSSAR